MYNNLRTKSVIPGNDILGIGLRNSGLLRQPTNKINGLKGYWKLSGNGIDETSNNNLTATNVTFSSSEIGYNKELSNLTDVNSYLSNTATGTMPGGTGPRSMCVWFNRNGNGTWDFGVPDVVMAGFQQDGNNNVDFRTNANGGSGVRVQIAYGGSQEFIVAGSPTSVIDNKRHFLYVERNGLSVNLYIDNKIEQAHTLGGNRDTGTTDSVLVGQVAGTATARGKYQDFRIYDRPLTDIERTTLYYEGLTLLN